MTDVTQVFKDGDKITNDTVAKRLGNVSRREAMVLCMQALKQNKLRKVDPAEVGWGAKATKSKIFSINNHMR